VCRTHSRKAQVFFHVSAVEGLPVAAGAGGDLSTAVRPGQHVEFEVQEADGRLQAVGVRSGPSSKRILPALGHAASCQPLVAFASGSSTRRKLVAIYAS